MCQFGFRSTNESNCLIFYKLAWNLEYFLVCCVKLKHRTPKHNVIIHPSGFSLECRVFYFPKKKQKFKIFFAGWEMAHLLISQILFGANKSKSKSFKIDRPFFQFGVIIIIYIQIYIWNLVEGIRVDTRHLCTKQELSLDDAVWLQ